MDIPFHPIEGRLVKMEPLMPEHKEEVRAAVDCDPTTWSILLVNPMGAGFEEYWSANCGAPLTERLPYVIRRLSDGQVVGVTTYFTAKAKHGGVEIGATFLRPDVRASYVNPETKLLMLGHAFDQLSCVAVEFRTHFFNSASRAAIERLGAKLDGVLRSHQVLPDGSRRDTVVYSILDIEWPAVRNNLRYRLDRNA